MLFRASWISQNTPEAPKNNANTPIMLPITLGRVVSRLNHGLNGFRAISAHEPLDLPSNLTLRGLHPKSQDGNCNRDDQEGNQRENGVISQCCALKTDLA